MLVQLFDFNISEPDRRPGVLALQADLAFGRRRRERLGQPGWYVRAIRILFA